MGEVARVVWVPFNDFRVPKLLRSEGRLEVAAVARTLVQGYQDLMSYVLFHQNFL